LLERWLELLVDWVVQVDQVILMDENRFQILHDTVLTTNKRSLLTEIKGEEESWKLLLYLLSIVEPEGSHDGDTTQYWTNRG